jgi:serine/threonine protein kinase
MTIFKLNDFKLNKQIGKGSFGSVFKGKHNISGYTCAIKKIRDEDRFRNSSKKEIEILSYLMTLKNKIDYFPIIIFYGDFMENNIQYIIFEFMDINLYEYYSKYYYSIELDFIIEIIKQLCQGLKFIHTKYIHADLKPENIMINKESKRIKIIDLGSSMEKNKIKNCFYHQSRYYRAPEIIFHLQFNEKIDIWSLGCITYELITKKPLFKATNTRDLLFKMIEKIDIPNQKEYLESVKFNKYFTSFEKEETEEYFRIEDKKTIKQKYKIPSYCLVEDIYKHIQFFKDEECKKQYIIDFICKTLKYDFEKRPSAEECLSDIVFSEKI